MGNLLRALKQKQGASSIDSFSDLSLSLPKLEAIKPSFKQGALKAVFHQPTQEATILYTFLAVFGTAAKPSKKQANSKD